METKNLNPIVLVTGATGLLGTSLVPFLVNLGYNVKAQSRKPGTNISIDMTDIKCVEIALDEIKPNFIINLISHYPT